MARWQPIQLVGGAYADDALPWSSQDCVNYIPVPAEKEGTRSREMLRCLPGYGLFCDLGTNKPIRGMRNVEGRLFVVSGTTLFQVNADGSATDRGTIPGVKRCSLSHNQIAGGNEVVISNGQSGYIYNTVSNTLSQITNDGFPGSISFEFVDGYILGIEPARRFAFTSDLADAGSYNTLDRYEAEGSPDLLVGQAVTHREWWLMGERTIEPFVNTGAATGTFQRSQGTVIEVGLASTHANAVMDNSVFWLGSDGIVYRANGYTPQRISTHAIEQAISRCNTSQAFAFTFEDRGHKVFYLTFPDGQTWGYDAATGEWHRRRSHGLDRWRINALVKWRGVWIAGDYSNGHLYQLDWNVQSEAGAEMERRRITGVTHDNQNALIINGVELVVDTGLASQGLGRPLRKLSLMGDLGNGTQGDAVSYQYVTAGGWPQVTVEVVSGALPDGLTMSSSGLITGARGDAGSYTWGLLATDATGAKAVLSDSSVTGSTDLVNFFTVDTGLNQANLSAAVFGGIIFIGRNNSSAVYSLDQGSNWTSLTGLAAHPFASIKYNGDWYIMGHSGDAAKTSGDTFTFTGFSNAPAVQDRSAAILDGRLFVGWFSSNTTTNNTAIYRLESPGSAWTQYDFGVKEGAVQCMLDVGNAYLFGTDNGKLFRTTDFSIFTQVADFGSNKPWSLARHAGRVIVGATGNQWADSTDNGLTWSSLKSSPGLQYVCSTPTMFVAGDNNNIFTSPDGITWTQRLTGSGTDFFAGQFVTDGTLAVLPRQNVNVTIGTT